MVEEQDGASAGPLAKTQDRLRLILRGFKPLPGDTDGLAYGARRSVHRATVDRESLPLTAPPRLALNLIGCHNLGRAEKLDWEVPFEYEGIRCSLTSEKFGMRLYVDQEMLAGDADPAALVERIVSRLVKAQRVVESEVLKPLVEPQLNSGEFVVVNQAPRLRGMYMYFRDRAKQEYEALPVEGRITSIQTIGEMIRTRVLTPLSQQVPGLLQHFCHGHGLCELA